MDKRSLGKTGPQVTVIGHGTMDLQHVDDRHGTHLLNAALDAGVNFIDTAPDYDRVEELIGKAIAHRRNEYYLATKCGCNVPRDVSDTEGHVWTRKMLAHNIELSLKLMRTDHVDLWQIHGASLQEIRGGELIEAMQEMRRQGKVRYIGYSAATSRLGAGFHDALELIGQEVFDVFQFPYSMIARTHEASIAAAAARGDGVIVRSSMRKSLRSDPPSPTADDLWARAKLDELLGPSESRAGFMLRFGITNPGTSTVIIGTKNPQHLAENVRIADLGALSPEIYAEVKRRLDEAGATAESI